MNHGPHEAKLRSIVDTSSEEAVTAAQHAWNVGSGALRTISLTLHNAAGPMGDQLGETGSRAEIAFRQVSKKVSDRAQQMKDASDALTMAHGAIVHAQNVKRQLDENPLGPAPTAPQPTPGSSHQDDVDQQRAYHSALATHNAAASKRESDAAAANTHMDTVYAAATEKMMGVHGKPDPQPTGPTSPTGSGGGGGGTTPGGGSRTPTGTHHYTPTGGHVPTGTGHHVPPTDGGGDPGYDPHDPNHDTGGGTGQSGLPATPIDGYPTTPSTGIPGASVPTTGPGGITGSTAGGIAGAVGGGAIGGMTGIGGAVRGPMAVPTGSSAGGASSGKIGASSRSAGVARGALGRSSGLAEEGAAGGRSGAASSARSAGGGTRGGGKAGSRGAAGGRGTGASGGQGGKNKKDPKKKGTEFFDDEQDWVDDEGAAPGVID
ncbi:hypothetical protein FB382_003619 [Nocardioides ginsengisegetis]|uniref:Uncharacterized protein n=1 Tax=Nocardioides ginsengisegetis TaxID=661491 RepID=A0A7W3J2Y7_9ACTN|nr:hypothetical protein [Nocardioides ginsengisegetis]MBA8805328.1 hypothetical protein [Nocardioides ginsengisegetis]